MNQPPNDSSGTAGRPHAHPVALRDQLTQTMTAAKQLRSILATVDDPGRRLGEHR
ncbi:MAG: hypothetical protein NVS3B1_09930 [Marmoricola sp.]